MATAGPASGQDVDPANTSPAPPVHELATGLEAPFGISARPSEVLVAENGRGQITRIDLKTGKVSPYFTGLPGPAGVTHTFEHMVVVVTAGPEGPDAPEGAGAVWGAFPGKPMRMIADLVAYELEHNPDGQLQFDPETGEPLDALSNPFSVMNNRDTDMVLVADGGANVVLSVSRHGEVSTFFVPPTVNTGGCEGMENNSPETVGCDSVPTGLAYGPDGNVYVSALTAEVEGEGRVYKVHPTTGEMLDEMSGFTSPTGVAVDYDGNVYVSELLHNAPPDDGPPPPGFDPSTVGRIVKVAPDGTRTYLGVTMPTGITWNNGRLYSTAWSIAGFLGIQEAGQVVQVDHRAFGPEAAPADPS